MGFPRAGEDMSKNANHDELILSEHLCVLVRLCGGRGCDFQTENNENQKCVSDSCFVVCFLNFRK